MLDEFDDLDVGDTSQKEESSAKRVRVNGGGGGAAAKPADA